jgi:hypothetical protein
VALDASTLEWIRRLPSVPTPQDLAAVRALRRSTREPGDIRLLESLLASAAPAERAAAERRTLETRLAYLESQDTPETQARIASQLAAATKQLTYSIRVQNGVPESEAARRAQEIVERQKPDAEARRSEMRSIRRRLRELDASE